MSRVNKEYKNFMAGMMKAQNIVEKEGKEALKVEIKKRGFYNIPVTISSGECDKFIEDLAKNLHTTIMIMVATTLDCDFGFGKKRLEKFKAAFDKRTLQTMDMNWVGNHYVTLEDYAKELNAKYDWDLDESIAQTCQATADAGNKKYKMVRLERLVAELAKHGHTEAADWLLKEWHDY